MRTRRPIAAAAAAAGLLLLSSCSPRISFRLGFSSALTGRQSSLGKDVYEGALLATEELNAEKGPIRIELVLRDDAGDPARALENDRAFAEMGLEAVSGHATSAVAAAVLPFLAEKGMVFIGASTSSPLFDGIDDPLFQTVGSSLSEANSLADYLHDRRGAERFLSIHDSANESYAGAWARAFAERYESMGGEVAESVTFSSADLVDYEAVVAAALKKSPNAKGLSVVASPLDAAALCQAFRKRVPKGPIVMGGWAGNADLIKFGGVAVEGALIALSYNSTDKKPRYLAFRARFAARFGRYPAFGAVHSYEAVRYLETALRLRRRGEPLKDALMRVESMEGLQRPIRFDRYGDAYRPLFLITVKDGVFVTIDELEPDA